MRRIEIITGMLVLCALFPPPRARGEWRHLAAVTHVETLPDGVELQAGEAAVRVTAISNSVIRVRLAPHGSFPSDFSFAVLPQSAAAPHVSVEQSAEAVEFATSEGKVHVTKSPLRIVFLDLAGHILSEDAPSYGMASNGAEVRIWKTMPPDESYFGLGDKAGSFNRRNQAFTMWNTDAFGWGQSTDPLYKSIPFFLALRHGVAHGIFFDNTYRSSFDFGKESESLYSFGAVGGELNYYFIYGPHPKKVVKDFTALVGRSPMPPLWALGYQQCRYSYYPEARVREIARTFREKKIPADVIYLDIDYQSGNRPFTVDRQRFPNFEGMIHDLSNQGFHTIAISDLHIKKEQGYAPYDSGMAGGHFLKNPDGSVYVGVVWPGESVFPDFTRSESRAWYGALYKNFVDTGISGFWNDMNEPAIFMRADKTMPLNVVHRLDGNRTLDHGAIHNVYGMENVHATFDGLRKLRPNERPFVLTRAAYAGTQRYAATWTGDNSATWNHYQMSIPNLLSLGISGYALVGDDIGGYHGDPSPELLTRWMELGTFNPIDRSHAEKGSANKEPWVHGPQHETIRKRYIELRYELMPYIYTITEDASTSGVPVMRPIFLEFPEAQGLAGNDTEFLFGPDLLVAPKMFETTEPYDVTLPPGIWYDYWNGTPHAAGRVLKVNPALDVVPLYVRAGAILPQQPIVQNTGEKPDGPLTLRVYPGENCRGSIYLDDGHTYNFVHGEFLRTEYACQSASDSLTVTISPRKGSFKPWWDTVSLEVYGMKLAPTEVRAGDRAVEGVKFDDKNKSVKFILPETAEGTRVSIALPAR